MAAEQEIKRQTAAARIFPDVANFESYGGASRKLDNLADVRVAKSTLRCRGARIERETREFERRTSRSASLRRGGFWRESTERTFRCLHARFGLRRLLFRPRRQRRRVRNRRRQQILPGKRPVVGLSGSDSVFGSRSVAKAFKNGVARLLPRGQNGERQGRAQECHRANPSQLAERRRRLAAGHYAAPAAANPEPASFGALEQHHADQHEREDQMDDKCNVAH